MKAVILALIAIVAFVNAEIYQYCDKAQKGYDLQVSNVVLSPEVPVSGEDFGIKITGTLGAAMTAGKAKVHVDYAGVELYSNDALDVCSFPGFKCPVAAGAVNLALVQNIPSVAPPGGPYTGKVELFNQDNKLVTCITFNFEMGSGNGIHQPSDHVLHDDIIHHVNSDATSTWVAHRSPVFEQVTIGEIQSRLGAHGIKKSGVHTRATNAPEQFDSREQWPGCVHPIRNQGSCGSCWAFSASEVLSDRLCIASKKSVDVVLSPQYMVNCDSVDHGCQGGQLAASWNFLKTKGIPADSCNPYESGVSKKPGQCADTCADGQPIKFYKAKNFKLMRGEAEMIEDIMNNGPIEVGFMVYRDFTAYKTGVYQHRTGALLGGHAVKIVGWGVDEATQAPYWNVQNSWGESWGEGGFFRIARGRDECGIETNVVSGEASL